MILNAEEPREEYDDWNNYRDGIRINDDKSKIRNKRVNYGSEKDKIEKQNKKLKREVLIRKFRNLQFSKYL